MVDTTETVMRELEGVGRSLTIAGFLETVERLHPHDRPGVDRETLDAYIEELEQSHSSGYDADTLRERLEGEITDSETWEGEKKLYRQGDDRFSVYPQTWHERLGGSDDIPRYVAFLQEEVPDFKHDIGRGGAGQGIPEQPLLEVVSVVGRIDYEEAKARLEELREEGVLAEDADQHPDAGVVLAEDHDEFRDASLDS